MKILYGWMLDCYGFYVPVQNNLFIRLCGFWKFSDTPLSMVVHCIHDDFWQNWNNNFELSFIYTCANRNARELEAFQFTSNIFWVVLFIKRTASIYLNSHARRAKHIIDFL